MTEPTIIRSIEARVALSQAGAWVTVSDGPSAGITPYRFAMATNNSASVFVGQLTRDDLMLLAALIDRALVVGASLIDPPTTTD